LLDEKARTGIVGYRDTLSVLQLIEVTQDKKWAIVISMPAEIEGRVETYYLLLDLLNRELVNAQLEKYTGSYISGSMIYFETGENNRQYLIYSTKDEENCKVELK
jgi:hypothetical protein